ncbi:hypothetical protein [Kitasatospora acidiphila]|uniref:hypothetical protein n=1 Tax=Kitasatospora acidiphila TaxID=2567942 RepID=UPI003C769E3F
MEKADCTKVFQEKISTRVHRRSEMDAALAPANAIKETAFDQVGHPRRARDEAAGAQRGRADAVVVGLAADRPAAGRDLLLVLALG